MKGNPVAFTIDIEDGISITMRDAYGIHMPPTNRVVINTKKILNLLDEKEVKGTFFILGVVAEFYPDLIKEIAEKGHEIGVHGYYHLEFTKMNFSKAFEELSRSKKILQDLSGQPVNGHRAPAFSINSQTAWALDIIYDVGFSYDSSIMPIQSGRYGWPGFKKNIHLLETTSQKKLMEVPITCAKIFTKDIPSVGGRYFQILPYWFSKHILNQVLKERPGIFYMHPYEIDESKYPSYYYNELNKANISQKFKTYIKWFNRTSFYPKLSRLLSDYNFKPLQCIITYGNKPND